MASGDEIPNVSGNDVESNSGSRPSGSQGMGIPAILYFPFWAVTSFTFLHVGFCALDKTQLSNTVLPVVMSLFKHFLAIIACCSSNYGLLTRLQKQHSWFWFDPFAVLLANTFREDRRPLESPLYRLFKSHWFL